MKACTLAWATIKTHHKLSGQSTEVAFSQFQRLEIGDENPLLGLLRTDFLLCPHMTERESWNPFLFLQGHWFYWITALPF